MATTTAATAAVATSVTATPTTAASAAFSLWTSLVHHQRAAQKILAVEGCNRLLRFAVIVDFGEPEAARLSSKAIAEQRELVWLYPDLGKKGLHLLFRRFKREVPNVQFLHVRSPGPCQRGTPERA
jgi:hypothetical protein